MEGNCVITSLGYVLKKEKLASFASQRNYAELILEDLDPFPGFYDHYYLPANESEKKPRSIFVVLKELDLCKEDKFIRMTMYIKSAYSIRFDAAMAIIELFNKATPSLRIMMEDYEQLPHLMEYYKNAGLTFHSWKDIKPFSSLIEVRKFFEMEILTDGIYRNLEQPDTYYLRVPGYLPWDDFERITISIRNNMNHKLYDAAQAAIYEKTGLVDLIRIYDRKANMETLVTLRQKYITELERL